QALRQIQRRTCAASSKRNCGLSFRGGAARPELSNTGTKRSASPSPSGRRWREAPDEGVFAGVGHPHPPLRATLSQRERDSPKQVSIFDLELKSASNLVSINSTCLVIDRLNNRYGNAKT